MNKIDARNKYIKIRESLINKEYKSEVIANKIIESNLYKNNNDIAFYYPLKNEVSLIKVIKHALNEGKNVYLPKVINDEMVFIKVKSLDDLIIGKFNIKEPKDVIKNNQNEPTLFYVPLICFDDNLNRVGYGKGFYDKYFFNHKNVIKVGVAFKEQKVNEEIESDLHDIKLDEIITY